MSTMKPGVWMDAIPGGYRRIPTVDLCRIWTMHLEGRLTRLDLRVWFTLHEIAERRCTLAKGRTPRFRIEEVVRLLGDVQQPAAHAAVRRLHRAGVCSAMRVVNPIRANVTVGRRPSSAHALHDAEAHGLAAFPATRAPSNRGGLFTGRDRGTPGFGGPLRVSPPGREKAPSRRARPRDLGRASVRGQRARGHRGSETIALARPAQGARIARLVRCSVRKETDAWARICRRLGRTRGWICMGQANQTLPAEDPTGTRTACEPDRRGEDRHHPERRRRSGCADTQQPPAPHPWSGSV